MSVLFRSKSSSAERPLKMVWMHITSMSASNVLFVEHEKAEEAKPTKVITCKITDGILRASSKRIHTELVEKEKLMRRSPSQPF
jgi:hypothetical protein